VPCLIKKNIPFRLPRTRFVRYDNYIFFLENFGEREAAKGRKKLTRTTAPNINLDYNSNLLYYFFGSFFNFATQNIKRNLVDGNNGEIEKLLLLNAYPPTSHDSDRPKKRRHSELVFNSMKTKSFVF
jgi:hypothetical protein